MFSIFTKYKDLLSFIISVALSFYMYVLKADIEECKAKLVEKEATIQKLHDKISLIKLDQATELVNRSAEGSSTNVLRDIAELQETARREDEKNISFGLGSDDILNGMFIKK